MYLIKSLNNIELNRMDSLDRVHSILKELRGNNIPCTFEIIKDKKVETLKAIKEMKSIINLVESKFKV